MAYASLPDVSALAAKRVFTATSIPSATQVSKFLDITAGEIDSILSADGYELPVPTGASVALNYLNGLNALGAWAQVEKSAQVSPNAKDVQKAWDDAKTEFKAGGVSIYDLPRLGGQNFARGLSAATPFFTRDMAL